MRRVLAALAVCLATTLSLLPAAPAQAVTFVDAGYRAATIVHDSGPAVSITLAGAVNSQAPNSQAPATMTAAMPAIRNADGSLQRTIEVDAAALPGNCRLVQGTRFVADTVSCDVTLTAVPTVVGFAATAAGPGTFTGGLAILTLGPGFIDFNQADNIVPLAVTIP